MKQEELHLLHRHMLTVYKDVIPKIDVRNVHNKFILQTMNKTVQKREDSRFQETPNDSTGQSIS